MKKSKFIAAAALLAAQSIPVTAWADPGRNYLLIVGSSTLQTFTEEVTNRIIKGGKVKRPLVESNGTNGGFTVFCEGVGSDFPDIVNASRPIKKSEYATCQKNGVGDLVEVKIGFDGVVVASSKKAKPLAFTRKDLYLALAKNVIDPACKEACTALIPNPYKTWKQINPALPDVKIEVLGPPFSSGTSEVFAEAVLESGCNSFPWLRGLKAKDEKEYNRACHNIRQDGVYTEETSDTIVSRLETSLDAVGLLNYNPLKLNASKLQGAVLENVAPTYDSLASQTYPVSRPLFFYVKKAQAGRVPGLEAYLAEFTSEKALGAKGYLAAKGLIALPSAEQKLVAADAKALKPMVLDYDHKP